jgi:hypothetical protein
MMGRKFKGEKIWGNCQKLFLFVVKSCECFWSSKDHKNMSVESMIEKPQKITKEKELQKSEHRHK